MNIDEITKKLKEAFDKPLKDGERRRLIFWMDRDHEFVDMIDEININNVKIHKWTESNHFYTKYLLEEIDPASHYLIYTTNDINNEDNWLWDTVQYSQTFYADKISLLMNDLGIDPSLRSVVKQFEKFFNNRKLYSKFKSYALTSYSIENIEVGIMSACCNLRTPEFEGVLKAILMDDLDEQNNKHIQAMAKFFDPQVFWKYVRDRYGYNPSSPSLKTLLIHLTVTALSHAVDVKYLDVVKHYIASTNRSNSYVFIDHWMHHRSDSEKYHEIAEWIEQEIRLPDIVNDLPVEVFKQADTFPYFDKAIIIYIVNSLEEKREDYDQYIKLINHRRAKHFYPEFKNIYEALYQAVHMSAFYHQHATGIPQGQAVDMLRAYVADYSKMDTYYRKFYVAFDREAHSEILKKLRGLVEHLYTHWFMGELSSHWSMAVESEMKQHWALLGIRNQQHFFKDLIAPRIRNGERIFVIISDALRYEAGMEVAERLNSETSGSCEIEPMLSVVPSITKLGMASLLPYNSLDIDFDGRVLVDQKTTSSLDNRKEILASKINESTAVHIPEFKAMSRAERREFFKGKKLVYLYHDVIDATGDHASTELNTFTAVDKAIDEIIESVKVIRDDLGGTNIIITADHGFIYQREALEESDKIQKEELHAIEVKRRYMLSQKKKQVPGVLDISLDSIINNEHNLTAYVPRATIRYKIQGSGVNYVHGGASLQEIVIPLIQYKNLRASQKNSKEVKKVDLKLTTTTRRITNSIFHLDFFQTEKVEDKIVPRTVVIYMTDESGSSISNEEIVICDRTSDNPEERTFRLRFALKTLPYDKNKSYDLIIKDEETKVIVEKVPFKINLGIVSDFDF